MEQIIADLISAPGLVIIIGLAVVLSELAGDYLENKDR